jgi:hypothetical protein
MLLTLRTHESIEVRLPAGYLLRVFAGDRDVTPDCQSADNGQGWALLLARNERGHHYAGEGATRSARYVFTGDVRFVITDATGRHVIGDLTPDGDFRVQPPAASRPRAA